MPTMTKTITVRTKSKMSMQDITSEVKSFAEASGMKTAEITLFVPHTTAAITINENADPDVQRDMITGLADGFPDRADFKHMEGNSQAHILSSVIGASETVLLKDGQFMLGTWQGIYFCEFDGPRTRKLHMRIRGE
ncbi:MAG: secondary thiamine-phosphate synthase enzyme YjbQ [Candidatus Izemoplasmataceae bacterium]